jgi:hypothetical protein
MGSIFDEGREGAGGTRPVQERDDGPRHRPCRFPRIAMADGLEQEATLWKPANPTAPSGIAL